MKSYLLKIEDKNEKLWDEFKKRYKKDSLGTNLDQAIFSIIGGYVGKKK